MERLVGVRQDGEKFQVRKNTTKNIYYTFFGRNHTKSITTKTTAHTHTHVANSLRLSCVSFSFFARLLLYRLEFLRSFSSFVFIYERKEIAENLVKYEQ